MTPYAYWFILFACVSAWIAWDTKPKKFANPQAHELWCWWHIQTKQPLRYPVSVLDDFETWCAAVDLYMYEVLRDFPEKAV